MVKAIFFDIDDTLYSFKNANAKAFSALCDFVDKKFGWSAEHFSSLHKNAMNELFARMGQVSAAHNRLIRYQNILAENLAKTEQSAKYALEMCDIYWNTLIEEATPFPELLPTLAELKKRGFWLGIGTNMTALIQFRKLEKLGVLPFVDYVVSSEEAGADKPDKKFFDYCVEKSGFSAAECLFVGDDIVNDISGARQAGLLALQFCPDEKSGEGRISAWSEILDFAENLGGAK